MNKKILIALGLVVSLMMVVPVFATTTRFTGLTYAHLVTTQAQASALPADIDALGYDIGVLVDGDDLIITGIEVHDATKFGIAVDGRSGVDVMMCSIYNIGTHVGSNFVPNGVQQGVGIYYWESSGVISGNDVSNYQKGGIVANYPRDDETVYVLDNTVTGLGPVDFIAQNGIQIGMEAKSVVRGNTVSGNYYIDVVVSGNGKALGQQAWVSCGILMYGVNPSETKVAQNKLFDNQVQFYMLPAKSIA